MKDYGGNEVQQIVFQDRAPVIFSTEPYYYAVYKISAGESLVLPELSALTIYAYDIPAGTTVEETSTHTQVTRGDAIQAHHRRPSVAVKSGGPATFLVAGVPQSTQAPSLTIASEDNIKKVTKPWGYELWINGEHPEYALKRVFIKHPHKTSLQFHNFKQETIVLFSGEARLHYNKNNAVQSADVKPADVGTIQISPPTAVHIKPPVLHRFEAFSDLTLYEASTPHLHDVIRVSDDSHRPDGKIDTEHQSAHR